MIIDSNGVNRETNSYNARAKVRLCAWLRMARVNGPRVYFFTGKSEIVRLIENGSCEWASCIFSIERLSPLQGCAKGNTNFCLLLDPLFPHLLFLFRHNSASLHWPNLCWRMSRYEEEGKGDTQARFKITDVALDKRLLRHKLWETKLPFMRWINLQSNTQW